MSLRTLFASTLIGVLSPLKTASFLFGSIAVVILITGCSSAEPEKNEAEKQASSAAEASSEDQKAAVSSTKAESTTTETVQAPKTAMSPKETYIQMLTEDSKIKTVADLEAVYLKYGSKKLIAGFEAGVPEIKAASETERDNVIAIIRSSAMLSKEIATIQESINGSTATVSGRTKGDTPFVIILVLENNQWKVDTGG